MALSRRLVSGANCVVQLGAVTAVARLLTNRRLRIVAYHDVADLSLFSTHIELLSRLYVPVGVAEVVEALRGGAPLPPRSVWLTFDDGYPSAIAAGAALADAGFSATLFVCPGVVGTHKPLWWQDAPSVPQATLPQLRDWVAHGHTIGNHTWDHPLLDRCARAEQRHQITRAHEWLVDHFPGQPLTFAYPNGAVTTEARDTLRQLGYGAALRFDHRLARVATERRELSRLRVDSDVPVARLASIVSGAHPTLFHASRWLGSQIGAA